MQVGITPGKPKQRATAGAWVLESRTSVACMASLRTTDGKPRETSIRPCGIGGRRCGLASLPSYPADWLRCCECGCRSLPLPMSFDVGDARRQASTGRQAGEESEALTASAPVAGEHITNVVINVKLTRRVRDSSHERWKRACHK